MCVVVKTKGITSVGNDAAKKIDNGNFFGWWLNLFQNIVIHLKILK